MVVEVNKSTGEVRAYCHCASKYDAEWMLDRIGRTVTHEDGSVWALEWREVQ